MRLRGKQKVKSKKLKVKGEKKKAKSKNVVCFHNIRESGRQVLRGFGFETTSSRLDICFLDNIRFGSDLRLMGSSFLDPKVLCSVVSWWEFCYNAPRVCGTNRTR